jgi:hypothetical protein
MPGTAQTLTYSNTINVFSASKSTNFVDTENTGHRVQISMSKSAAEAWFRWERTSGSSAPVVIFDATHEDTFKTALESALTNGFVDLDGNTNGLHFGTANLSTNTDSRLRANGTVSANDLVVCYMLYKIYGKTMTQTINRIFTLGNVQGLLSNSTLATAIINSLKTDISAASLSLFNSFLAADPVRFFDASGNAPTGLFETSTDVSGSGPWIFVENDILQVSLLIQFNGNVTRKSPTDVQQTILASGHTFPVRLQIKFVNT